MSKGKQRLKFSKWAIVALALLAAGCDAVIGGAVIVGVAGVGVLAYSCDEPVGVDVWDRSSAHPACDADVTAESEGRRVSFSPCYRAYLGTGTWTVTATKPGYAPSTGTVLIAKERRCSEPSFHSLQLTLGRESNDVPVAASAPANVNVPGSAPAPAAPSPTETAPAAPVPAAPTPTPTPAPVTAPPS